MRVVTRIIGWLLVPAAVAAVGCSSAGGTSERAGNAPGVDSVEQAVAVDRSRPAPGAESAAPAERAALPTTERPAATGVARTGTDVPPALRPIPGPLEVRDRMRAARARGLAWSLANQRPDGSFGTFESPRAREVFLDTQSSHRAFHTATTALVCWSLVALVIAADPARAVTASDGRRAMSDDPAVPRASRRVTHQRAGERRLLPAGGAWRAAGGGWRAAGVAQSSSDPAARGWRRPARRRRHRAVRRWHRCAHLPWVSRAASGPPRSPAWGRVSDVAIAASGVGAAAQGGRGARV